MSKSALDIFNEATRTLNALAERFHALEVFLNLATWDARDDWRQKRTPIPQYAWSFDDCIEGIWEARSLSFHLLIDLPPVVRPEPIRFNNHTCVSYTACLDEIDKDIAFAMLELKNSEPDRDDRLPQFKERVRESISEWNGIEHMRSTTTRPFRAIVVAALTEIHAESLQPGFADHVNSAKSRWDELNSVTESDDAELSVLNQRSLVAPSDVNWHGRTVSVSRGTFLLFSFMWDKPTASVVDAYRHVRNDHAADASADAVSSMLCRANKALKSVGAENQSLHKEGDTIYWADRKPPGL